MTDEANTAAASADAHPSQVIEHREADANAQGRGASLPEGEEPKAEDKKPLSTRDAIAKAFDENEAKAKADKGEKVEEKPAEDGKKPEADAKADPKQADKAAEKPHDGGNTAKAADKAEGDKSAPDRAAAGQGGDEARQSEGRKHAEPPARFLPEARTKWANVPNEVKAEVHRVSQEYEGELTKARESADKYEAIRQYDELSHQNGRGGVKGSLEKMVQIEQALARSPAMGLELILREVGPRKQDGSPVSLYELAHAIAKQSPQQFQQNMNSAMGQRQQPQQQQRQNPEMAALTKELQDIKSQLATSRTQPVIEQFKANRPDYHSLEPQIAEILKSGVVQKIYGTGLSPEQKLEQAYRMAGGQGPSSQSAAPAPAPANPQATPARPDPDPDGQKSIRGAPSSGQSGEPARKFKSNRAALEAAFDSVR